MPDNPNLAAAWTYHNATKHSYTSIRSNAHFMDWNNQPLPFKIYPTLEPMRLPGEVRQSGVAALSAMAERVSAQTNAAPDLEAVAQLLYLSAGITRRRKYSGGEIYSRAAACTGALYEVELYLVCGELGGLEAGVYPFGPAEFGLRKLRAGDYRGALVAARPRTGTARPARGGSSAGAGDARGFSARFERRRGGVGRPHSGDTFPAARRANYFAQAFVRCGDAARPDRAGHSAARLHSKVCAEPDHPCAGFHPTGPRHARRARGFSRSTRSAAQ